MARKTDPTQPQLALTPYLGEEVLAVKVSVSNTGDGLSKSMGVDPIEPRVRERLCVVFDCEITAHYHQAIANSPKGLELVLRMRAEDATIVPRELVQDLLDNQKKRIEEKVGIHQLQTKGAPGEAGWDEDQQVLATQHRAGVHGDDAGLRDGCPLCDEEAEAMRQEAAQG